MALYKLGRCRRASPPVSLKSSFTPSPGNLVPVRVRASDGSALQTCLYLTTLTFFGIIINSLHFELETAACSFSSISQKEPPHEQCAAPISIETGSANHSTQLLAHVGRRRRCGSGHGLHKRECGGARAPAGFRPALAGAGMTSRGQETKSDSKATAASVRSHSSAGPSSAATGLCHPNRERSSARYRTRRWSPTVPQGAVCRCARHR